MTIFKLIFKYLVLLLIFIIAFPYLISPFYVFPDKTIFSGNLIYNPYEGTDSLHWIKTNFQSHSRLLFGLTDGRNSESGKIIERYKEFGYDIIGISDYMYLNPESYFPVYEHGYGFIKNHFLILGEKKINWFDILLYKNIHHKQFLINRLKNDDNIIVIAHPSMQRAFEPEDFNYLGNYDIMEILRYDRVMTEYLDSALSSGHKTFLMGNDDSHDIESVYETGQCYNLISCDTITEDNILHSIKTGKLISVQNTAKYTDFDSKIKDAKTVPVINNISLEGPNISIRMSTKAKEVRFIGQNGITKKILTGTSYAEYDFKAVDTYIRTEIIFDKVKFYLNPFFRYSGSLESGQPEIDFLKTLFFRIFVFAAITFTIIFLLRIRFRIKGQGH